MSAINKRKLAVNCVLLAFAVFAAFLIGTVGTATEGGGEGGSEDNGYFTAMWVATAHGLDFSGVGKTASQMKRDIEQIVSVAKACHFDAINFQVRPSGDAFYKSDIFPYSKWLSGEEGKAPDGGFDPLAYLCRAANKHGIEVHAWVNPYRLTTSADGVSAIARKNPHLVMETADGLKYLNPGNPESITLVVDGVKEILENYPVAGIVFDDYFYPSGTNYDDSAEYAKFGGGKSLEDWRRDNTYSLVKAVYAAVHGFEGKVFGVSPCGVWRNLSDDAQGSDTRGLQSYSALYADTRMWVKDGILDYIAPQIYWQHGHPLCDFETLVRWWAQAADGTGVKLYVSHAVYKIGTDGAWSADEIKAQLETAAANGVSGSAFYRYSDIRDDRGGIAGFFEKYLKG